MAEYHVGCGIAGIYAGTLNKGGKTWRNKSDVTHEAMTAVAQYCIDHNTVLKFTLQGKRYALLTMEIEEENDA